MEVAKEVQKDAELAAKAVISASNMRNVEIELPIDLLSKKKKQKEIGCQCNLISPGGAKGNKL